MTDTKWYTIEDLYTIEKYKIKHNKNPKTKWIRLPCVYKIKINETVVEVGRSDTCKKHGGAEKVRKAIVNLLDVVEYNPSVTKTKRWEQIRLRPSDFAAPDLTKFVQVHSWQLWQNFANGVPQLWQNFEVASCSKP